ncbi:MAG: GAF domain-containing protein [Thermoleophilia bacterium]
MLGAVVRLLSEASAVHACFVYLVEDDGERLVLRAASEPYAHLVGRIALERGEGIAWWAAERREPVLIRDEALADPRFKYVPELAEERFQSLVSVPILARAGGPIGAITLHTEAPREFAAPDVEFLVSSASLVAGAIENARLYAETRQRVSQLELLNALAETIARAATAEELLDAVAAATRELLDADACALYLLDPAGTRLALAATSPATTDAPAALDPALLTRLAAGRASREPGLARAAIRAGDAARGLLELRARPGGRFRAEDADLARTAASQAALGLEKLELIERLTERNAIADLFEELAAGRGARGGRAARLGLDVDAPHVVLAAAPTRPCPPGWDDRLEAALVRLAPGALVERRAEQLRALLPLGARDEAALLAAVRSTRAELGAPVAVGLSSPCRGEEALRAGFDEAAHALVGAGALGAEPTALAHGELGPYRYLLRLGSDAAGRDPLRDAVSRLARYDAERSTSLLPTLAEYLARRGSITATSQALFVHANTLRQRLRRIEELTGLSLADQDWLALEIAVRLVALDRRPAP